MALYIFVSVIHFHILQNDDIMNNFSKFAYVDKVRLAFQTLSGKEVKLTRSTRQLPGMDEAPSHTNPAVVKEECVEEEYEEYEEM